MAQFLNVVEHQGVYFKHYTDECGSENFQGFLFNLNRAAFIYFNPAREDMQEEIRFILGAGDGEFSLYFSKAGMGEYHRYKREIETYCISTSNEAKLKLAK